MFENGIYYKLVSFDYTKANSGCKVFTFRGGWILKNLSLTMEVFMFQLPVTKSQREPVYSIRSDESRSSRSQALGCCFYASTSVSGSSGTPPMLASPQTSLQQSPLGKWMHPMTPLGRAGHLKTGAKRNYVVTFGEMFSLCD